MKKKEMAAKRAEEGFTSIASRVAKELEAATGLETRAVVPGHIQRGGSPSARDRILSTRFGVHAAELIRDEIYGMTVAMHGDQVGHNRLCDIAGKAKPVPTDHEMVNVARNMGICMGD